MSTPTPPSAKKPVIMSGMRPTGRLHLGHYMGVLKNWVALQDTYDCHFMVADWHALTTRYDETESLDERIREMILDWLAAGLDPARSILYVQSEIKEIAELHLLFSMITPNKWVETDPTLKDLVSTLHEDLSYGLLGYPVLQTADILVVRGQFVPVGEDQLAHLEIARDIARRFNHLYQTELFPEPKALLTPVSKLAGLDGRKMSKSYGNAINIADSEEETWQKVKTAITDPARVKRTDPGNPEACVAVYQYYKVFADEATTALAAEECSSAKRGCMDCKKILSDVINAQMAPLRQRRAELAETPDKVNQVLDQGIAQMRPKCQTTLEATRKTMHLFGTTK